MIHGGGRFALESSMVPSGCKVRRWTAEDAVSTLAVVMVVVVAQLAWRERGRDGVGRERTRVAVR